MTMLYMTEVVAQTDQFIVLGPVQSQVIRVGHSDVHIDDGDYVDPPPKWKGTSIDGDSSSGESKSADITDRRTHDSEDQLSNNDDKLLEDLDQQMKKKFNDKDDAIRLPFSISQYLVGNKTWWYELVSREVSLNSSHMNVCFYYIRQVARIGKNLKFIATTTDSLFQTKLKHMYPRFKDIANVFVIHDRLIDDITSARIPLSIPWAKVDLVLIPLLPTIKSNWMLGVLDIKTHTLRVLNSSRKT
ncbi:Hypothetical predicted protein [Olea europaea subsp. europaea]|uniref:Ubiquitin-like protease family profile domain-containing protein n=1 Tax=Olea europaea subsp. europaea TaxID=158383 RepID=A0A8S0VPE6_OLEEU|nr:Hypothetical predicted protein [Olea europaea subsp. europaea]